ncbi:sex determination protein fruitless isoform X2 [Drosophila serrata]|uniref:sex determination protein fruitless isoform X2 n=1 Tax=Drosophila serrata TaxID=7274 RepID=UPI000A1D0504|nr:sex determination protein fruitless isoform X2 [Drosophila serrata]
MLPQQYCLRWKYHHSNLQTMFSQLLDRGCFCDVTLACEGQLIRAHRVVLCACSTFFDTVLSNYASERDPIIIMKDVTFAEVKCLIEFMYKGEINVEHASLPSLLKTADDLKIKGLAEVTWRDDEDGPPPPMAAAEFHSPPRGLAESFAQDLLLQQQQQQQGASSHLHSSNLMDRERERERDRLSSPGMESVLGRMPVMTPHPGAANPGGVGGGTIGGGSSLEGTAPVEHYLGPKRKRGRPPLDDAYDVFNVRKLAQYAANLEPAQRAYLETARHFAEEPPMVAHSASLASPPAACPPKQRQRLRNQQQQQQQQQQQLLQSEATEQEARVGQEWAQTNEESRRRPTTPMITTDSSGDNKQEPEATVGTDELDPEVLTSSGVNAKKPEKVNERRERHGKLRHARRLYEKSTSSSSSAGQDGPVSSETKKESSGVVTLPQSVEEIENEHLVANRGESPRPAASLLPTSIAACSYEAGAGGGGGSGGGGSSGSGSSSSGYLINEHGIIMAHEFAPNAAASAAAAATAAVAVAAAAAVAVAASASAASSSSTSAGGSQQESGGDYPDIKLEDYDAAELRLTNEELSQWQDVIKMDDYLAKGRRPQFWEEPFTKRVLDAIKNKRLEMKKAARILGVSYGTLYGRYREVYGCLKHPYSGTAFRNSGSSSAASQLGGVQPRFDLGFRNGGVLPAQLVQTNSYLQSWAR